MNAKTQKQIEIEAMSTFVGKTVKEVMYDDTNDSGQPTEGGYTIVFTDNTVVSFSSSGDDHTFTTMDIETWASKSASAKPLQVGSVIYTHNLLKNRIEEVYIVGENRVSWLVTNLSDVKDPKHYAVEKVNKKELAAGTNTHLRYKKTRKEVEDTLWRSANRWRIAQLVDVSISPDKLRQIAFILGYKEPTA